MPKIEEIYADFELAAKAQSKLLKAMEQDFEFVLGKQWKDKDVNDLEKAGVKALTINKIKPMLKIITGIERQSRSDYQAFPEGEEDELLSEVVTKLLKNVVKGSRLDKQLSNQFKEGVAGGLCYLEPYMDYTYNLINGEMHFRKVGAKQIFPDPNGEEYDYSDRRFIIKLSTELTKDQLLELFPDKSEKFFEQISFRRVDVNKIADVVKHLQTKDYEHTASNTIGVEDDKGGFDLIEYYYKQPVARFYLVSPSQGILGEFETKDEAEEAQANVPDAVIIKKRVPEIRLCQVVGDKQITDEPAWTFPRWKVFPLFPFMFEYMTLDIKDKDLLIQGLVRSLRDLQEEFNKRRTQELRHLNSTANSGWLFPKGALDRNTKSAFKRFGSSPGFVGEYDATKTGGTVSPDTFRIRPGDLSLGHKALAEESAQDIKEASGINPDLLANDSQSQSGRAILLKQRQGLVMIQEALDNYAETKKLLGRFILSQLGEVYTVESALKVLGEAFIHENFSRPQIDMQTGQPVQDDRGELVFDVDTNEVGLIINKILNDSSLGKFDVSIGEGAYSETARFSNFLTLMEMAEKGVPIPPDVLVMESLLSEGQKKKIVASIEKAQQAQQAQIQPNQGEML